MSDHIIKEIIELGGLVEMIYPVMVLITVDNEEDTLYEGALDEENFDDLRFMPILLHKGDIVRVDILEGRGLLGEIIEAEEGMKGIRFITEKSQFEKAIKVDKS